MRERLSDFIVGVVLLVIAFGIMAFFPRKVSVLTWIIIFVSALAFCFGYFRVGIVFDRPMGKPFLVMKKILVSLAGIALIVFGFYSLFKEDFNGKGLGLFSLNLIYGLSMQYYAFDKLNNMMVDDIKQSDEVSTSIDGLYNAFKDIDTPMGRPWIGHIKNVEGDCLIYGPTDQGAFFYGYYLFGTFMFGESPLPSMLTDPENAALHTVNAQWEKEDSGEGQYDHSLSDRLPDLYISMFENFSKTGRAVCDFADMFESKTTEL